MEFLKHFLCLYMIRDTISFCGTDSSGIKVTTQSAKSVHVAWDTTQINCGYTITGYKVYFNSLSPLKTYKHKDVSGATTDNVEIYPIVPGFSYNIFVKPVTANGIVSNPSSINYTHPHSRPSVAPSNIHVFRQGLTTLTVHWDAISLFFKNGDVKGYQIYYRGPGLNGTKSTTVLGETNRQFTLTGLQPNSTYQFILRVINDVGPGPYSSFIHFTTLPLPMTATSTTTSTTKTTTRTTTIITPTLKTTTTPTTTPPTTPTTTTTTITTSTKSITTITPRTTTKPTTTTTPTTTTKPTTTTITATTAAVEKNTTTLTESTALRLTTFKRTKHHSSVGTLRTTTLPRVTHTAVTTIRLSIPEENELKPFQIAGIVICCMLTVCLLIVWYILYSSEKTRKWIKIRRIQPIHR